MTVLGVAVVSASPPLTHERAQPTDPACAGDTVTTCVWPQDSVYLPMISHTITHATTDVAPFGFTLSGSTSEMGLADNDTFTLVGDGRWTFADGLADQILGQTYPLGENCDIPETGTEINQFYSDYADVSAWVTLRLYRGPRPSDYHDTSTVDWSRLAALVDADTEEQREWLAPRMHRLRQITDAWCPR